MKLSTKNYLLSLFIVSVIISNFSNLKAQKPIITLTHFTDLDYKHGYYDQNQTVIIEPIYDYGEDFSEGFAAVTLGEESGFIDVTGETVIEIKYGGAKSFSSGLAAVMLWETVFDSIKQKEIPKQNWGFIDKTEKVIIELKYSTAESFSMGLALVSVGNEKEGPKYGCIDLTGKVIVPLVYDEEFYFEDGIASVVLNGVGFNIDRQGKRLN